MNEHLIDQLRELAADLPEERIEQLVDVLQAALIAHELNAPLMRAEETSRIYRKALSQQYQARGRTMAEAHRLVPKRPTLRRLERVQKAAQEEYTAAIILFQRVAKEANIKVIGALPVIQMLPRVFAATGDYGPFDWRVSIDREGMITVEKREFRWRGGVITIPNRGFLVGDREPEIFTPMPSTAAILSPAWQANLERAMDLQITRTLWGDTATPGSNIGGELRLEDLDALRQSLNPLSFKDLYMQQYPSDQPYEHTPIEVGEKLGSIWGMDIYSRSSQEPPKNAKAVQIRSGTAYLDRHGRIIRIDYD